MTMKSGRHGFTLGSVRFYDSLYCLFQEIHINYIKDCDARSKRNVVTQTFRDYLESYKIGSLKIIECIPGETNPINLNRAIREKGAGGKYTRRWLLDNAKSLGFTLDD